jgi:hypothetical protein
MGANRQMGTWFPTPENSRLPGTAARRLHGSTLTKRVNSNFNVSIPLSAIWTRAIYETRQLTIVTSVILDVYPHL